MGLNSGAAPLWPNHRKDKKGIEVIIAVAKTSCRVMEGTSCAALQAVNETLLVAQVKFFAREQELLCLAAACPGWICASQRFDMFWQFPCTFTPCRHFQSSRGAAWNSRV